MGAVAQPLPGGFGHQRRAAFQRLRLARCPGADPALQGAAVVIGIGLFAFDAGDRTAHPDLSAQGFPVHHKGGVPGCRDLLALGAVIVGVKDKAAVRALPLDVLQKDHAHVGHPAAVHGCKGDGVGVVGFGLFRLGQPAACDVERVVAREQSVSISHLRVLALDACNPLA